MRGIVSVPAATTTKGAAVTVVYEISNGISSSIATMRVDTADEFKNPPVVFDSFGQADDSDVVAVDVDVLGPVERVEGGADRHALADEDRYVALGVSRGLALAQGRQREQAEAAAAKITQFIKEIENQLGWTTQLPWSAGTVEARGRTGRPPTSSEIKKTAAQRRQDRLDRRYRFSRHSGPPTLSRTRKHPCARRATVYPVRRPL